MGQLVRVGEGRVLAENRKGELQLRKERSDGWTGELRSTFLDHLAATCNIESSAAAVGKRAYSAQALRRRDTEFAESWDRAIETGYATLEAMLVARAQQVVGSSQVPDDDVNGTAAPTATDMTTQDAIGILERHQRMVTRIRQGPRPAPEGRAATAKETYMAIVDRMQVLKIRMDEGE